MIKFLFEIDRRVLIFFQRFKAPYLDNFMRIITHSGDMNLLYIMLVIYFYFTRQIKYSINILVATAMVLVVCNIFFKNIARRQRPYDRYPTINVKISPRPNDYSMPSGHTFMAFAIATVLWGSPWMAWAYGLAVLMGISRMYVGVHYLSDVLVGMICGIGVGLIQVFWIPLLL